MSRNNNETNGNGGYNSVTVLEPPTARQGEVWGAESGADKLVDQDPLSLLRTASRLQRPPPCVEMNRNTKQ